MILGTILLLWRYNTSDVRRSLSPSFAPRPLKRTLSLTLISLNCWCLCVRRPLPDERPRQSVANLIGRFEQQTKRQSLTNVPPLPGSRFGSASPHLASDAAKEDGSQRSAREWPPKLKPAKDVVAVDATSESVTVGEAVPAKVLLPTPDASPKPETKYLEDTPAPEPTPQEAPVVAEVLQDDKIAAEDVQPEPVVESAASDPVPSDMVVAADASQAGTQEPITAPATGSTRVKSSPSKLKATSATAARASVPAKGTSSRAAATAKSPATSTHSASSLSASSSAAPASTRAQPAASSARNRVDTGDMAKHWSSWSCQIELRNVEGEPLNDIELVWTILTEYMRVKLFKTAVSVQCLPSEASP